MRSHALIIVGGGLAGLRAAIAAAERGVDCAVVSLVHPVRSHSGAAQGGINASLANHPDAQGDDPQSHAFDTVKGSDYLGDQDAIRILCDEAPLRIYELEHWGVPFSRFSNGTIAQRPLGGASHPRACYAADKTGHYLLHTVYERAVSLGLCVYDEVSVQELVVDEGRCIGLMAYDLKSGKIEGFAADAVILATGGSGRIYGRSTSALINIGAGVAMAYRVGVPVKDPEFVQFHPTTLYGTNILMSEGCRGEGGYLLNGENERFMERYAPQFMELAPRDLVARSIQREIDEGRGIDDRPYVHLDLRHLGVRVIEERLPGIRDLCIHFAGIDPVEQPIPIQPGQHYSMSGIDVACDGATCVEGLFAVGEAACLSVHGANRLGGNSLLETIVFGARVGESAAALAGQAKTDRDRLEPLVEAAVHRFEAKLEGLIADPGTENPYTMRSQVTEIMDRHVQVFRTREGLEEAVARLTELRDRYAGVGLRNGGRVFNLDMLRVLELDAMIDLALAAAVGAMAREESRGAHSRADFQGRDDVNWLKHTLAYRTATGPRIEYRPVVIEQFEPQERKY
ncbi:MAG: FAD-dependent oxidoreductase [Thermoleophilia bacterium]